MRPGTITTVRVALIREGAETPTEQEIRAALEYRWGGGETKTPELISGLVTRHVDLEEDLADGDMEPGYSVMGHPQLRT